MCTLAELDLLECDLEQLMKNERIRPEPEFQCFSKYLATFSRENFLKDEDIFNLIDCHGVQLRNDVKYWLEKNAFGGNSDKPVPILNPENFILKGIDDVVTKLKELPSEWTIIQITKKFSLLDVMRKEETKKLPGIYITRMHCGDLAERLHPYSVVIYEAYDCEENIFKILKDLIKMRREYFTLGRNSKQLRNAYYKTNSDLMSFVKELESFLLKQWICLFHGRVEDANLENDIINEVKKLVTSFCNKENIDFILSNEHLDVIYQVTLSAHLMKNKAIFSILRSVLYGENDVVNVSELMLLVENIKILNLSRDCALKRTTYNPLILILDNEVEMVPWEMIAPLCSQPVCRISSLHLLYALYKYHQPYIKNGFRIVEIDCTYCLINPSKDLESCEKEMKEFIKKRLPWAEVLMGKAPYPKDLISKLGDCSTYLYCGHGTGMQYLEERELKKSFVKGLILLFGCFSNIPKNAGGRTPHQNNTYTFISNGCPCTIGCIQDVGSTDADEVCKEMLSNFMPNVTLSGSEKVVTEPKEPNVLRALANAKNVCSKYWSKSAFVARGIPCKTTIGNANELTILRSF